MRIQAVSKRWKWFGEENFKVTDWNVDDLNDPFVAPEPHRKVIEENSGGGIRGILSVIAAYVHDKKAGIIRPRVTERWGTSTGAIIEASLTRGLSYEKLIDFYVSQGPRVFDENTAGLLTRGAMYSAKKLEVVLKDIFGKITMAELFQETGIGLHIIAYDAVNNRKMVINHNDYYGEDTSHFPVWVAVRASMSAPFYFGTFIWDDPKTKHRRAMMDGGVTGWNCSAGLAYNKAVRDEGLSPSDLHILSIGTGKPSLNQHPGKKIKKLTGFLNVISQANGTMQALMESTSTYEVEMLGREVREKNLGFQRWNIPLPKDLLAMDETNNIDELAYLTINHLRND